MRFFSWSSWHLAPASSQSYLSRWCIRVSNQHQGFHNEKWRNLVQKFGNLIHWRFQKQPHYGNSWKHFFCFCIWLNKEEKAHCTTRFFFLSNLKHLTQSIAMRWNKLYSNPNVKCLMWSSPSCAATSNPFLGTLTFRIKFCDNVVREQYSPNLHRPMEYTTVCY